MSSLTVHKYGGTSVASVEHIQKAARKVSQCIKSGQNVIVVVSAMGDTTEALVSSCHQFQGKNTDSIKDFVLSAGEQITAGLFSLALNELGHQAVPLAGWQIPIYTSNSFTNARIQKIETEKLHSFIEQNIIPVITGFQGITKEHQITTFGRGGSDLTAVALAVAMDAEKCELYKDVRGLFSCDPKIVKNAQKLNQISYEELLELSSLGAEIIQTRAVELAMKHRIPLNIKPNFDDGDEGTQVLSEAKIMENNHVSGLVWKKDESKITLKGVSQSPMVAGKVFGLLAQHEILVDMIINNGLVNNTISNNLGFTISQADQEKAFEILQSAKNDIGFTDLVIDQRVAKISIVGIGMRGHACVAQKMFEAISEHGIQILGMTSSEIKLSILVSQEYAKTALKALHDVFELDKINNEKVA